jgi:hypothetical protein
LFNNELYYETKSFKARINYANRLIFYRKNEKCPYRSQPIKISRNLYSEIQNLIKNSLVCLQKGEKYWKYWEASNKDHKLTIQKLESAKKEYLMQEEAQRYLHPFLRPPTQPPWKMFPSNIIPEQKQVTPGISFTIRYHFAIQSYLCLFLLHNIVLI